MFASLKSSSHSVRALQRIELPDGFDTTVTSEHLLDPHDTTLVFLVTDFGAAASEIRVEMYKNKRLHEVFRSEGDSIEILHLTGGSPLLAVHHRLNSIDVPDLFEMTKGRFRESDSRHPQYCQGILEAQHLSRQRNVAPSLAGWLANLLEFSGGLDGAADQRARAAGRESAP